MTKTKTRQKRQSDDTVTLDTLFAELEKATSLAEAQSVERVIWATWHWHKIPRLSQKLNSAQCICRKIILKGPIYF